MSKRKSNPATEPTVVKAQPARASKRGKEKDESTETAVLEPKTTRAQAAKAERLAKLAARGVSEELDTYLEQQWELSKTQPGLQFLLDDARYAKNRDAYLRAQFHIRVYGEEVMAVAEKMLNDLKKVTEVPLSVVDKVKAKEKEKEKEKENEEDKAASENEEEEEEAEEAEVKDSPASASVPPGPDSAASPVLGARISKASADAPSEQ